MGGTFGVTDGGEYGGLTAPTPGFVPEDAAGSDRSFAAGRGVRSLRCAVGVGNSTFVNASFALWRQTAKDVVLILCSASPPAFVALHARRDACFAS